MSYMMEPAPSRSGRRGVWVLGVLALVVAAVVAYAVGRAQPGLEVDSPAGQATSGIRWERLGPWVVPTSAGHGPFRSGAGLASGFSHDDLGAALAAINIVQRFSVELGPQVYVPTVRAQAYGDVETLLAQIRAQPSGIVNPITEMAYKALSGDATSDLVLISMAVRTASSAAQGGWYATAVTLRWHDGDWRAQVPLAPGQLIRSVEGYQSLGGPGV